MDKSCENNQDFSRKENQSPAEELVKFLTCEQLSAVENRFKCGKYAEGMTKEEFFKEMKDLIGFFDNDELYLDFFNKYEISHRLTWNSTLGALINAIPSESDIGIKVNVERIHKNELTKRDAIVKIVTIETSAHFCYTVYSKFGRTGIYNANFKELATYHIIMTREDINRKDEERRRRNRWITDAIYIQNLKKIVVINTTRSLVIYDVVGLKHIPAFLVLSLPNIPMCITHKFEKGVPERYFFIGDDKGSILVFTFTHKKEAIFRKKHNDKLSLFYWEELNGEKDYVKISTIKDIHDDIIKEIIFCREDNTLLTCSRNPKRSVAKISFDHNHKTPRMIYEMPRGSSAMCCSKKLNLLITGSSDGTLRLWNTLVVTNAIAVLKEHKAGIKSILLLEIQKIFFSCSKDGDVKLWSIDDQKCYQTINLSFPCFEESGKIVEWATKCMFLGPKEKLPRKLSSSSRFNQCGSLENGSTCVNNGEEKLERSNIWVSCHNFLASISISFRDPDVGKEFEMPQLKAPPKQNNVFIPGTWLLNEESFTELSKKIQCDIEHPEKFKDYEYLLANKNLRQQEHRNRINEKIALLDNEKREMQENVARGAPFLALKLFDIENLSLSNNLVVHGKEEKTVMEKSRNLLVEANNKDQVFSELSSSRSRSSRSSVVEFEY